MSSLLPSISKLTDDTWTKGIEHHLSIFAFPNCNQTEEVKQETGLEKLSIKHILSSADGDEPPCTNKRPRLEHLAEIALSTSNEKAETSISSFVCLPQINHIQFPFVIGTKKQQQRFIAKTAVLYTTARNATWYCIVTQAKSNIFVSHMDPQRKF